MSIQVHIEREGGVAELRFANPPHNHVNLQVLTALADALDGIDSDPAIRAVVLSSEGKAFCAGADLANDGDLGGSDDNPIRHFYNAALRLYASRKPIVAAVQGAAIGAGLGLAVAVDFRVADPAARFSANFTRLGFHPGFGLTHMLPRLIGAQRAALMALTSRRFKAEDVLGWGLIDALSAPGGAREAAWTLAREIAENAPLALLATRATMRGALLADVTAALERELAEQNILRQTTDYAEGVASVFERRPAQFTGH